MTLLGIHYLTGCVVATDHTRSDMPEFPPHFGRVFMAMAASHFETRGNQEERSVLEWLEAAGAPSIKAGEGSVRTPVKTFVPVNDKLDSRERTLPVPRSRQSRSFPTTRLDNPFVFLRWNAGIPEHLRGALEKLCGKVTRVGHSSSLVQMWVADAEEALGDTWEPDDRSSALRMRVVEPGTLAYLECAFNAKAIEEYARFSDMFEAATGKLKKQAKNELEERFPHGTPGPARPVLTRWQGYAKASGTNTKSEILAGPFGPDLLIFTRAEEQKVLGLEATLQLTSALRDAAMKALGRNVPEWLSGHQVDGRPSLKPHASFFPLPFVGAPYADGHIMGLAIAIPREIEVLGETKEEALRRVVGSLLFRENGEDKTVRLWRNQGAQVPWKWELKRETRDYPPLSLRASTWTRPSAVWASVTPVVLHHYPKRSRPDDVSRIVLEAFASAGLPAPRELRVRPVSVFSGAGHVKSMPEFTEGGGSLCRHQVHIWVRFPDQIEGPLLVGRGRFRGYGLLRPVEARNG